MALVFNVQAIMEILVIEPCRYSQDQCYQDKAADENFPQKGGIMSSQVHSIFSSFNKSAII